MIQHLSQAEPLVLTIGSALADECRSHGLRHVRDVSAGPMALLDPLGRILPEVEFFSSFVILIPEGGEDVRDTIALNLGDEPQPPPPVGEPVLATPASSRLVLPPGGGIVALD